MSPNVGHLILKYLCPALREVLQDGLKAHLLDLIVGQRRCQPWSLVEASTQLGEDRISAALAVNEHVLAVCKCNDGPASGRRRRNC